MTSKNYGELGPFDIIIVGTGLGALGAVLAAVELGKAPLVIDVGKKLPPWLTAEKNRMGNISPELWTSDDVSLMSLNASASFTAVPRKLIFGSDYFYGPESSSPPHSLAFGGFSSGWGGAFLPPQAEDLDAWPISAATLRLHAVEVMKHIPVSEPRDELSRWFPPVSSSQGPILELDRAQSAILKRIKAALNSSNLGKVAVGQSRLMTLVPKGKQAVGGECRRCGYCMSGCVYDAIFSSAHIFEKLEKQGKIQLLLGQKVLSFVEHPRGVKVSTQNCEDGTKASYECNRLFVGAGAVESTRIVVRSIAPETKSLSLLKTGGAVIPIISLRKFPSDWPQTNTQSSVFLDFQDPSISERWVHTQLAPSNELFLQKLGLQKLGRNARQARGRWMIFERLAVALVNMHSDFGASYTLHFSDTPEKNITATTLTYSKTRRGKVQEFLKPVRRILWKAGMFPIFPLEKDSADSKGYHLGGSLPMRTRPKKPTDTDTLGRPGNTERVHVVDASVLPSLPGTTIGLLILSNSHRIASQALQLN
jgi:choline dehydrogenase-like flavoprotein